MRNAGLFLLLLICVGESSCKRYLEAKPTNSIAVPSSIADAQKLLDNYYTMNLQNVGMGEGSSDNYFVSDARYDAAAGFDSRRTYLWQDSLFRNSLPPNAWSSPYTAIEVSNLVLETLEGVVVGSGQQDAFNNAKGSALCFRAFYFFKQAVTFCKGYNEATKNSDLGLPLRLSSDYSIVSVRSNVAQTYERILEDYKLSIKLLPKYPQFKTRPSRSAAYAGLAETYLAMHDYRNAMLYADSSLQINSELLDYNDVDVDAGSPFAGVNPETFFVVYTGIGLAAAGYVDSLLYNSYDNNDLRRSAYFIPGNDNQNRSKGGYGLDGGRSGGFATDEMYLVRAEGAAHEGNIGAAMTDLNKLLIKRYKSGFFTAKTASTVAEALDVIRAERRKELVFRDMRWGDLKRLNLEGANIVLTRKVHGQLYTLPPNDNRYALPLPDRDIQASGMQQNPR